MKTEGKRNLLRQPDEIRLMTGSAQTEQETAPDAAAFRAGDVTVELAEKGSRSYRNAVVLFPA